MLTDSFHRHLTYLRVSVTDRCNLRCVYCAPKEILPKLKYLDILRYEEILRLVRIGVNLGVSKVRVTGGEPLFRKGIDGFLSELGRIDGIADLSLTTNGVLLANHIRAIRSAGIRRINVSLDTLNRETYQRITGYDGFHQVWDGILQAHEAGFYPIKINAVAMKGVNDGEIAQLAELSIHYPFHIRFIEQMPIGNPNPSESLLLADDIMDRLQSLGKLIPVEHNRIDGPAERYRIEHAEGEIGLIRPISRHFCSTCNRLRLTASGHLRLCLLSDDEHDVKRLLRTGCSDAELADFIVKAVQSKPLRHHLENQHPQTGMSAIGG